MNDPATSHDQRDIANLLRKQNELLEDIAEGAEITIALLGALVAKEAPVSQQKDLYDAIDWQRPSKRKEKGDG